MTRSHFQQLASVMQKQFPALIHLTPILESYQNLYYHPDLVLPDGFLGGCAPRLQSLELVSIAFPTLTKFLLSTTDLVRLSLEKIPDCGFLSPEEIVTSLGVLANLKFLSMGFESSFPFPHRKKKLRGSPLPTRTVLPTLTRFQYQGSVEYIEDLMAQIDAPLLDFIWITFQRKPTFNIPHLAQFMKRTTRFQALNEAHVLHHFYDIQVDSFPQTPVFCSDNESGEKSGLRILCKNNWRPSDLAHLFTSLFPSIYIVEHLYIRGFRVVPSIWRDDFDNVQWLEVFRPFTSVRNIYVSKTFNVPALQDFLRGTVTDALPTLESLFVDDLEPSEPVQEEVIGQFISARQLIGHPVGIFPWGR